MTRDGRVAPVFVLCASACASPEPRGIPVDPARAQAFEACPRPAGRRDGAFRALLDARLDALGGDVLALAEELRMRDCIAEVFVSPPVENLRELHLTYREGDDPSWVVDLVYPDSIRPDSGRPRIGGVMRKATPEDPR